MAEIFLQKNLNGSLSPVYDSDKELLRKFKSEAIYRVKINKPRNYQYHQQFFTLLNIAFENQDIFQSRKALLDALKLEIGHCEPYRSLRGETHIKPKSISFSAMDDAEFSVFFNKIIDAVLQRFLPTTQKEDLLKTVFNKAAMN